MNKKILFLILFSVLLSPLIVLAQEGGAAGGCTLCATIIHSIENVALLVASGVVVVMWIVTGLLFLTASGAPEKLGAAKKGVIYSLIGTAVVIIAGSAIALVSQILGIG